jgi:hypothetical protein
MVAPAADCSRPRRVAPVVGDPAGPDDAGFVIVCSPSAREKQVSPRRYRIGSADVTGRALAFAGLVLRL